MATDSGSGELAALRAEMEEMRKWKEKTEKRLAFNEKLLACTNHWVTELISGRVLIVDANMGPLAKYRTIQEALDEAVPMTTVLVRKGRYKEGISINCGSVKVIAAEGTACEIWPDDSVGVKFNSHRGLVSGFLVRQGSKCHNMVRFEGRSKDSALTCCTLGSPKSDSVEAANLSAIVMQGNQNSVSTCRVYGTCQTGITVKGGTGHQIERCLVTESEQPNIMVESDADEIQISGCIVTSSQQNGIWFKPGASGGVSGCLVSNNGYSNIDIMENATPNIVKCHISQSRKCGICIAEKGKGTVQNCDIYDNDYSNIGIMAEARPVITNNRIFRSRQHGIFAKHKAQGQIVGNNIYGNHLANVKLEDGEMGAEIEHRDNQNTRCLGASEAPITTGPDSWEELYESTVGVSVAGSPPPAPPASAGPGSQTGPGWALSPLALMSMSGTMSDHQDQAAQMLNSAAGRGGSGAWNGFYRFDAGGWG